VTETSWLIIKASSLCAFARWCYSTNSRELRCVITEHLLEETEYFGFPVVLTENSQLLAGFVYRTEISWAIGRQHWDMHAADASLY
jgi:hypothetical protein